MVNGGGPNKDRFPKGMKETAIASAIKKAYENGKLLKTQGEEFLLKAHGGISRFKCG